MATTAATNVEIDALIGSLNSVYAGDRGHALRDLHSSLLSSLGNVALGSSTEEQPTRTRRQTSPDPSCPSPPRTPPLPQWTLLPPAALDTKHKARPANLPTRSTRSTRSLYMSSVQSSPYSFASMSAGVSRGGSKHNFPDETLDHRRHHHHRPRRPTSSRCSSASTLSSVTLVGGRATSPRSPMASPASAFDVATPKLSPGRKYGLALTPLDGMSGASDMYKTDSANSAAESIGTLSPSFPWGQSSATIGLYPSSTYNVPQDSAVSPCTLPLSLPTTTTQDEQTSFFAP